MAIATDDFNRANSTGLGASWGTSTGDTSFNISSNTALAISSAPDYVSNYRNTLTPDPAQYSKVILGVIEAGAGNVGSGPAVRMATGARTYYYVFCNDTQILLLKLVNGSGVTVIGTHNHVCTAGNIVELRVTDAHVLTVYLNENPTAVITVDQSASSPITTGRVGIIGVSGSNESSINSWEGGDLAPVGPPGSWGLNDSSPVTIGQAFDTPASPWTLIYWGPGVLAFETPVVAGAAFVAVPTGELTISGPVPTVLLTALVRITPETGALRLNTPYRADTGILTADSSLVTADTGAQKGAPTVLIQYVVQPGLGQLTVTGFAPTIGLPKTIVTGLGQATLTGFSPKIPKTIVPALGQPVLTGFAATVGLPVTARPGFGQLTVTGFAPSVSFVSGGASVTPGVGLLTVTGFAATVPKTIVPATGLLTATGFAPAAGLPVTVRPGFGELTVTGHAPTVSVIPPGIFVTPGTGQLVLTGYEMQVGGFRIARFSGGPVLTAQLEGGGQLTGSLEGGEVFDGELVGGPV